MAQARLDAAINGPTKEQLDMGRAAIRQAEAAANMLRVQVDKQTLRAPMSGVVGARSIHIGEVAVPGSTLLTIINIDTVKLTIYIAETDMGRVYIGQKVEVLVDAFPREVFPGEVVFVSSQAEFRPRGVQTTEERATQVFAVKVRLPNPEGKLKPGMPVEARLLP
jgi:RND family efflux transporter MFP subunit